MKVLKYAAILPIIFSCIATAQAKNNIFYTVPFYNVEVKAASKIYVNYNFDTQKQTLACTSDQADSAITSAEWTYKDTTRKIGLPINLKDNAIFPGYYADSEGKLVITNDFDSETNNGSIFVSCEYHNVK